LSWDANSPCNANPYVTDPSTLTVAHYNGSAWDQAGTSGSFTGNATAGTVTRTGVTVFSPFSLGNTNLGDNPLPVRFGNIKASLKPNGIQVDWTNYTESDLSYYTVEHSTDGISFTIIARISPTVNDGSRADYSYMDLNPGSGANFYRVRSLETSSKITYSQVVRINSATGPSGINIYPNPVIGSQFILQAAHIDPADYDLKIYNNTGQLIMHQPFHFAGASVSQSIQLPAGAKPGVYSLVLASGEISFKKTFVIQ
jgi:hypothetical protein